MHVCVYESVCVCVCVVLWVVVLGTKSRSHTYKASAQLELYPWLMELVFIFFTSFICVYVIFVVSFSLGATPGHTCGCSHI